jgi:molybdopterin molybdotransferase
VEEPVRLLVAGVQKAGDTSVAAMPPGTAVRIMTGAPCPPGADAVVPFEQTSGDEDVISVSQMVAPGTNIRPIGEEYRAGDELLAMGTVLRPAHLALLAANGRAHVSVRRAARVAVIAAGNELREPGQPLGPGQIWESNSIMVTSLGGELGGEIATAVVVPDQESEIQTALERAQAAQADLVVTVGGISAGDYDLLKQVLAALGNVELWDVAMRPGRPLAFGRISGVPVIGLPGNPAAAFVSFHQFVRPLLARLMGRDERLPTVTATSLESFQNRFGRRNFVRVVVERHEGRCVARSAGSQGTASILSLARANGLLAIPESVELVEAGESVEVQLLGGGEHYGNVVSMRNQRQASRHAAERGQGMT